MRRTICLITLVLTLGLPAAATADDFSVGVHTGVLVPQVSSELGSFALVGLEFGYTLPWDIGEMKRPLGLQLDLMGTAPGASGGGTSMQLGEDGRAYSWELTSTMVVLELTASWRLEVAEGLGTYLQAGPRAYFVQNTLTAEAGNDEFGERTQGANAIGGVVALGGDLTLGPGAVFVALEFGGSDLNTDLTGDANTGALAIDLGYRLGF